jgi:hypothetical protein
MRAPPALAPHSMATLVLMAAAGAFTGVWRHLQPGVSQVLVKGLIAGGQPAGAALVASLAASTAPAAKGLSLLLHLPQLLYYVLCCQWSCCLDVLLLAAALGGSAAHRAWRLEVGGCRLSVCSKPAACSAGRAARHAARAWWVQVAGE